MARDVADDNYYVTTGGKIPVKWTSPEVANYSDLLPLNSVTAVYHVHMHIRQYFTRSILYKVMCGVLDVSCMKYGAWGTDHLKITMRKRYIIKCCTWLC